MLRKPFTTENDPAQNSNSAKTELWSSLWKIFLKPYSDQVSLLFKWLHIIFENSSPLALSSSRTFPRLPFQPYLSLLPIWALLTHHPGPTHNIAQALHSSPYFESVSHSHTQTLSLLQEPPQAPTSSRNSLGPTPSSQSHLASLSPHCVRSSLTCLLAVLLTHQTLFHPSSPGSRVTGLSSFEFQLKHHCYRETLTGPPIHAPNSLSSLYLVPS